MATIKLSEAETKKKQQLNELYKMLKELFESNFYGALEIKFEAGKVTIVKKTESIKI
ncbi:hypothetical protein [Deferribacter autotrophicus]|uniref:hypothetical protein n=1 Tax=Deferribacter autotrophicus TaxID=500465 RepID=UPI00165D3BC9|nr:hypothetical protein [Deferribacter autotrophicus]